MAKILVTCAGSGVGQSVIDSINLIKDHSVVGCDANRNVYANHFCESFIIVPSIYSEEYIDTLIEVCILNNIDLVIPGHDYELLLLSENIIKFENKNINVIVSLPDLIEISRDKHLWYNYFSEYGCSIVPTYIVSDFKKSPIESIFPAIVKPSGGSASQGIIIINNINELNEANDNDIIQPYLFPKDDDSNLSKIKEFVKKRKFVQMSEISIQLIFSLKSELAGVFISKNTLKNGVPIFINPIDPEEFEYLNEIMKFVDVCKEKKVKGPVNIQGRITNEGLICFEMNMRFTGITGNRAQLGFNEVAYLIDDFLGKKGKLLGYAQNKLGVRQVACITIPRIRNKSKTFTILGGGGFIGSFFVNELIKSKKHFKINLICRESSYDKYLTLFDSENVSVYLDSDKLIETIYCQSDVLINFASALAYQSEEDKYKAILFQYEQVQKIIKANIPLVINTSSQSIYDQTLNVSKKENAEVALKSLYSFQKYISESFFDSVQSFSPSSNVISLRFSRVIGTHYSGIKPDGFFSKIIENLMNGTAVEISNPLNNTNLIDIKDVIAAIMFVIDNGFEKNIKGLLNVGGVNVSLKDYCDIVIKQLGFVAKKELISYSDNYECKVSSMIDSGCIQKLGWYPQCTVQSTIQEIYNKLNKN